ncbi:hypothetical protein V8C86DRAFT_2789573 [Haematococcus lacustris]
MPCCCWRPARWLVLQLRPAAREAAAASWAWACTWEAALRATLLVRHMRNMSASSSSRRCMALCTSPARLMRRWCAVLTRRTRSRLRVLLCATKSSSAGLAWACSWSTSLPRWLHTSPSAASSMNSSKGSAPSSCSRRPEGEGLKRPKPVGVPGAVPWEGPSPCTSSLALAPCLVPCSSPCWPPCWAPWGSPPHSTSWRRLVTAGWCRGELLTTADIARLGCGPPALPPKPWLPSDLWGGWLAGLLLPGLPCSRCWLRVVGGWVG